MKIELITSGLNVAPLYWKILSAPEIWNTHTQRTENPNSPHHELDDVWVRFGQANEAGKPHRAEWYPVEDYLETKSLCLDVMRAAGGTELGGVLLTRIPPGKSCKPHTDSGWHAEFYEKYAVQIASAPGQKFCFEGEELETKPGDLFKFNNHYKHWVTNDTAYERVTLIICVRKE